MNAAFRPKNFSLIRSRYNARCSAFTRPAPSNNVRIRNRRLPTGILFSTVAAALFAVGGCPPDPTGELLGGGTPEIQNNNSGRSGVGGGDNSNGQPGGGAGSGNTNGNSSGGGSSGGNDNSGGSSGGDGNGDGSSGGDGNGDGSSAGDGNGDGSSAGDGNGDGSSGGDGDGDGTSGGDPGTDATVFVDNPVLDAIPTNAAVPTLPAGALRVVTLGDSLTEGSGDESLEGGGYPFRVMNRIAQQRPGATVLNLGRSGWSSDDVIQGMSGEPNQLDPAVAADPDIACLWIGSNDLWALYEYGPETGTTRDLEVEDLQHYAANIETILSRLKATGAALYVGLSDDQSLRPVIQDRATLPNTTAAEALQMSKQIIRYNNVLIAAAKRHGATVIDFYHTSIFTSAETLDFDGIHPNAAGYDVIADMWFAAMQPALGQ